MGRDARAKYDALRNHDNDRPSFIDRQAAQIRANRANLIDQLNSITVNLGGPDDLPWDSAQLRALHDAAQRLANATR